MKATDLMIGDWVMCEGKAEKIRSIGEAGVTLQGYYDKAAILENITPIPLTPEILERNGFEKTAESPLSKYYRMCLDENTILIIECHVRANYVNIYCHPNGDTFGISASIENCNVHEIQHALKLCGIEKEIVL